MPSQNRGIQGRSFDPSLFCGGFFSSTTVIFYLFQSAQCVYAVRNNSSMIPFSDLGATQLERVHGIPPALVVCGKIGLDSRGLFGYSPPLL